MKERLEIVIHSQCYHNRFQCSFQHFKLVELSIYQLNMIESLEREINPNKKLMKLRELITYNSLVRIVTQVYAYQEMKPKTLQW